MTSRTAIALGNIVGDDGMTALMIGHQPAIHIRDLAGFLFRPRHDAGNGLFDGVHVDDISVFPRRQQSRLVHHISSGPRR